MLSEQKEYKPIDKMSFIWDSLAQGERDYLRENTTFNTFRKGEIIYHIGDEPTHLVCLISGMVKVYKNGIGTNRQQIVRMAKPGDVFAYRAFLAKEPYCNSAAALEHSTAYLVPVKVVWQIIQSNNKLAMTFLNLVAQRVGTSDNRTMSLTQKLVKGRLAETLIALNTDFGIEAKTGFLHCNLSRDDLASLSNMTTSNAIRTLSQFEKDGIIETNRRAIKILKEDELRKISRNGG
ncbi:MAG: Crp/Fnr family transcriptional regulator [Prevotellaceae bacterium]|jgi:CRP-like cAMP-binding protein|nr:Crp/Fnr family transcriptional regulator [Prevotellaceae bacterium]